MEEEEDDMEEKKRCNIFKILIVCNGANTSKNERKEPRLIKKGEINTPLPMVI